METILPDDPHAPEDIAELIKFHKMTRSEGQSVSSYYHQLKQQAERSGITCCQDKMIFGGLIQSITDPDILEELNKIKNPRAEEIVGIYDRFDKVRIKLHLNHFVQNSNSSFHSSIAKCSLWSSHTSHWVNA